MERGVNMKRSLLRIVGRTTFAAAVLGLVVFWGASQVMAGDRPIVEECMRCHDVKSYEYEISYSSHAKDKDGKAITCDQCHDPHFNPVTSYYARDEYFDKKIFQPEDFDRRSMQKNVQKSVPAKKCQVCHTDLSKDVKGKKISDIGQLCHDAFEGKNGSTRKNCAGCHGNIAHLPDFDRDLTKNAVFVKKLGDNPMVKEQKGGS